MNRQVDSIDIGYTGWMMQTENKHVILINMEVLLFPIELIVY